jgi:hypothetical protein
VRIAGWVLVVLGALVAIPPLGLQLVWAIDETFGRNLHDPYRIVRMFCFVIAALGACVSGIGGLMVWVVRTKKP